MSCQVSPVAILREGNVFYQLSEHTDSNVLHRSPTALADRSIKIKQLDNHARLGWSWATSSVTQSWLNGAGLPAQSPDHDQQSLREVGKVVVLCDLPGRSQLIDGSTSDVPKHLYREWVTHYQQQTAVRIIKTDINVSGWLDILQVLKSWGHIHYSTLLIRAVLKVGEFIQVQIQMLWFMWM